MANTFPNKIRLIKSITFLAVLGLLTLSSCRQSGTGRALESAFGSHRSTSGYESDDEVSYDNDRFEGYGASSRDDYSSGRTEIRTVYGVRVYDASGCSDTNRMMRDVRKYLGSFESDCMKMLRNPEMFQEDYMSAEKAMIAMCILLIDRLHELNDEEVLSDENWLEVQIRFAHVLSELEEKFPNTMLGQIFQASNSY